MQQPSASARMMGLINGYLVSQALYVAATLGIADLLAEGPRRTRRIPSCGMRMATRAAEVYRRR